MNNLLVEFIFYFLDSTTFTTWSWHTTTARRARCAKLPSTDPSPTSLMRMVSFAWTWSKQQFSKCTKVSPLTKRIPNTACFFIYFTRIRKKYIFWKLDLASQSRAMNSSLKTFFQIVEQLNFFSGVALDIMKYLLTNSKIGDDGRFTDLQNSWGLVINEYHITNLTVCN